MGKLVDQIPLSINIKNNYFIYYLISAPSDNHFDRHGSETKSDD